MRWEEMISQKHTDMWRAKGFGRECDFLLLNVKNPLCFVFSHKAPEQKLRQSHGLRWKLHL